MNGLSDVRLVFRGQELVSEHERATAGHQARQCPPSLNRWSLFWHRLATRKTLIELTPEQLRDIGLTREQARVEGLKPFWRS